MKVVQKRFGPQVRMEVLGDVINSSFRDAVVQEKLRPAGSPQFEPIGDPEAENEGNPFSYTATFEVYPEFEPKFDESLKVEKPVVDINDSDVDDMLDNLCKQRTGIRKWTEPRQQMIKSLSILLDQSMEKNFRVAKPSKRHWYSDPGL